MVNSDRPSMRPNNPRDGIGGFSMDEIRAARFESALDDIEVHLHSLCECSEKFPNIALERGTIDPYAAVEAFSARMRAGLALMRQMIYCEEKPETGS